MVNETNISDALVNLKKRLNKPSGEYELGMGISEPEEKTELQKSFSEINKESQVGKTMLEAKGQQAEEEMAKFKSSLPENMKPEERNFLIAKKAKELSMRYSETSSIPASIPTSVPSVSGVNAPADYGLGRIQRGIRKQARSTATGIQKSFSEINKEVQSQRDSLETARMRGEIIAEEEQAYRDKQIDIAKENQKKSELLEKHRQDIMLPMQEELSALIDDVKNYKVDPNRFFKNPDAAQRMVNVIAAGFMTAGAALLGDNSMPGLKYINGLIDRDIRSQQMELEQKRTAVSAKTSLLKQMRDIFDDDRAAMAATKSLQQEVAAAELAKIKSRSNNADFNNNIDQTLSQLNIQSQQNMAQALQTQNNIVMQGLQAEAQVATQRIALKQMAQESEQKEQEKASKEIMDIAELQIPGMKLSGEKMPTKEDAKKVSEKKAATLSLLGVVNKIREHVNKYGWKIIESSTQKQVGKSLSTSLKLKVRDAFKLGSLAEFELKMLNDMVPDDPTQFWTKDVKAKLDIIEESAIKDLKDTARVYGYTELEQGGEQRIGIR